MARKAKTAKRKYTRRAKPVDTVSPRAMKAKTLAREAAGVWEAVEANPLTPEQQTRQDAFQYVRGLVIEAGYGHAAERRRALEVAWAELGKQVAEEGIINREVLTVVFDTLLTHYNQNLQRVLPTSHDLSH